MEQLLKVMRELREKCPWDQQQTPESLTKYAIEEAYEVEAAVRSGKVDDVRDELGDLLLQVVFQSQMYSEQGLSIFRMWFRPLPINWFAVIRMYFTLNNLQK